MNAETIVKHLRLCAQNGDCYKCEMDNVCDPNKLLTSAADLIESLQAQLAEAQRRADRAVEDLNVLRKRSGWKCFACKYDMNYVREVCAGCDYNNGNNWQWRGDAEEGDAQKV